MTEKTTTQQITDQIVSHVEEEVNRNKLFVILLGCLILAMAFFGKTLNENTNDAFDEVEEHFVLSNDYLSYIFDSYSCTTVDGCVKVAHGLKKPSEVAKEMRERYPITREKLKYYFDNADHVNPELIKELKMETDRSNEFLDRLIKNLDSKNGVAYASQILNNYEVYKNTDDILLTINSLLDSHLQASKEKMDVCQKSMKAFKKICIASSSIGFTIILTVILKFFTDNKQINENIQKRNNNIGKKTVTRRKTNLTGKK
jgi:hypothetical protein